MRRRGVTLIEMMMVVLIVSLIAGISFPAVSSGLDSIRMRSAADSIAAFLSQAVMQVERREEPVELLFSRHENLIALRGLRPGLAREMTLPEGVSLLNVLPDPEGANADVRSILVFPGATFPRVAVLIGNRRGQKRLVRIDPVTGAALVEEPRAAGE